MNVLKLILNTQNVIHAALETNLDQVVIVSTDRACALINLCGATKLTSDKTGFGMYPKYLTQIKWKSAINTFKKCKKLYFEGSNQFF